MKVISFFFGLLFLYVNGLSQNSRELKFIHLPHPRSEDKVRQSVLPALEKADYSEYDVIMLGGDLTWYTSRQRSTLEYCDSLFDLDNPNTLWSFGNHDTENRSLIKEFTGRESYYTYYRDGITFMVLDVELDASGFVSSFISGDQLQMVKNVCDTISQSKYLVVLHGRLLWMIGNPDLASKLDSVAESTKQLDTTNFYEEVYPQLKQAKARGVKVLCLGGDKSKINIRYSPEDSITFYATTMAPEFSDEINNVLVLNYLLPQKDLSTQYISLQNLKKNIPDTSGIFHRINTNQVITVWQDREEKYLYFKSTPDVQGPLKIQLFDCIGSNLQSFSLKPGETKKQYFEQSGMYVIRCTNKKIFYSIKVIVK